VKIGPVDPEIALLKFKKYEKEIIAIRTYSPRCRHAAWAK